MSCLNLRLGLAIGLGPQGRPCRRVSPSSGESESSPGTGRLSRPFRFHHPCGRAVARHIHPGLSVQSESRKYGPNLTARTAPAQSRHKSGRKQSRDVITHGKGWHGRPRADQRAESFAGSRRPQDDGPGEPRIVYLGCRRLLPPLPAMRALVAGVTKRQITPERSQS